MKVGIIIKKLLTFSIAFLLLIFASYSNNQENENVKHIEIFEEAQVNEMNAILNSSEWENAKVNMIKAPDYEIRLVSKNEGPVIYNLWISPDKEKIELVMPANQNYAQVDAQTAAKFLKLVTNIQ